MPRYASSQLDTFSVVNVIVKSFITSIALRGRLGVRNHWTAFFSVERFGGFKRPLKVVSFPTTLNASRWKSVREFKDTSFQWALNYDI